MPAILVLAFHFAARSILIRLLMSQRRKTSYERLRKEVAPFSVVFSSIVGTSAPTSVIPRRVINPSNATNLVSAFTMTATTFAPSMYISELCPPYLYATLNREMRF